MKIFINLLFFFFLNESVISNNEYVIDIQEGDDISFNCISNYNHDSVTVSSDSLYHSNLIPRQLATFTQKKISPTTTEITARRLTFDNAGPYICNFISQNKINEDLIQNNNNYFFVVVHAQKSIDINVFIQNRKLQIDWNKRTSDLINYNLSIHAYPRNSSNFQLIVDENLGNHNSYTYNNYNLSIPYSIELVPCEKNPHYGFLCRLNRVGCNLIYNVSIIKYLNDNKIRIAWNIDNDNMISYI